MLMLLGTGGAVAIIVHPISQTWSEAVPIKSSFPNQSLSRSLVSFPPSSPVFSPTFPPRWPHFRKCGCDTSDRSLTSTQVSAFDIKTAADTAVLMSTDSHSWTLIRLTASCLSTADSTTGNGLVNFSRMIKAWYRLELFDLQNRMVDVVQPVGVGHIYVTAGQSNSANHGESIREPTQPTSAWDSVAQRWVCAWDPQPNPWGPLFGGGSSLSRMGPMLTNCSDIPIAFVSLGPLRPMTFFEKLKEVVASFDVHVILWHQGETDAMNAMSQFEYATRLTQLVQSLSVTPVQISQAITNAQTQVAAHRLDQTRPIYAGLYLGSSLDFTSSQLL